MVKLERKTGEYSGAFGVYFPSYKETDYTGRWKINRVNGNSELLIECFELEEIEVKTEPEITYKERTLFWSNILNYLLKKPLNVERYKVGSSWSEYTKTHAKVQWISADDLNLTETEEFINTCSGDCE